MIVSVSVDPGISGTGWAIWEGRHLKQTGVLHHNKPDQLWDENARTLAARVADRTLAYVSDLKEPRPLIALHIEFPMLMESVAGIAANRGGATLKLAYLVGCISMQPLWDTVFLVTPMQWKGQLPKTIVQDRIIAELGIQLCNQLRIKSHAWDAVGIGLHGLGIWP